MSIRAPGFGLSSLRVLALAGLLLSTAAPHVHAAKFLSNLEPRQVDRLVEQRAVGKAITITGFPLDRDQSGTLELERVKVFADDAVIVHSTPEGVRRLPMPDVAFYSGHVAGDPSSRAFISVSDRVRGTIVTDGRILNVYEADESRGRPRDRNLPRVVEVSEVQREDDTDPAAPPFICGVGEHAEVRDYASRLIESASASGILESNTTSSLDARYLLRIAIDTDWELLNHFNGDPASLTTYVGALVGLTSTIYQAELRTRLELGEVFTYAGPGKESDPWAAANPYDAMIEVGNFWHNTPARAALPRSTVVLLSKKNYGGGIAWVGSVCGPDFPFGDDWGGGYGVVGSVTGTAQVNNKDSGTFWDVYAFAHELGHNVNSDHTHCTSVDAATYGRSHVDLCYGEELRAECYSGVTSVPAELGTIMSYCHLRSGRYDNINLIFGADGEASSVIKGPVMQLIDMRTPPADITLSALSVPSGSAGNTASVPSSGAVSYAWTITNGTITGGQGTRTLTYTAGAASPVTLRVTTRNANGCGVENFAEVAVTGLCTPTGITAQPVSGLIAAGESTTLSVSATNATGYQWYIGPAGDTSSPVAGGATASILVSPVVTTTYWVRVTGGCGSVDSTAATVSLASVSSGNLYHTITPCRIIDTRNPDGPSGGPILGGGATRIVQVAGNCGVPLSAASVATNITVVAPISSGHLKAYPGDGLAPNTAVINFSEGQIRGNNGVLPLAFDGSGTLAIRSGSGSDLHFVIDVFGYFTALEAQP